MKNLYKLFFASFVFSFLFLVQSIVPAYASFMTITSPNGGESYTVGQNVHITWDTDSTGNCSLYFQTPEAGPFTSYYVGNASASAKAYDWTAYTPTSTTSAQQEKIQVVCVGTPVDYSDNYFSVLPNTQPVCNKAPQIAFTTITGPSIYRGDSISNQVSVMNPNDAACGASTYAVSNTFPSGWSMTVANSVTVNPGQTQYLPVTVTSSSSASNQTYSYSVSAGGSSATGYVTVAPRCNVPVQVAFTDTSTPSIYRGGSIANQVALKNGNDAACGASLYGLSNSYPTGWSLDIPFSVTVNPGETKNVPITLTSSSTAVYQTYNYGVYAGGSGGGVLVGATGYVTVAPRCDATVQASLTSSSLSGFAGSSVSNSLQLTNPNVPECAAKSYSYSYSTPSGWNLSIQQNISVNSGQSVTVPFTVTSNSTSAVGSYPYDLTVYNAWGDGSGQAHVAGSIQILDNTAPTVSITSPANNSQIARKTTIAVSANASDNVGVTKVEFYVNGALTCTDTSSSYSCSFLSANQKGVLYTLTAKAYDAAGNTSSTITTVTTK